MRLRSTIFIVRDINKSAEFYQKLGFKIYQNHDKKITFESETDAAFFSIEEKTNPRQEPGKGYCSFWSTNVNGFFEKCRLLAVPLDKEITESHEGKMFAIKDLDGNKLEFIQAA